jgi:[ribosomal protein S5]-alanine N-acetyltransferase
MTRISLPIPRLSLRSYRKSDAPRLSRIAGVDSVARYTFGIPLPYTPASAMAWITGLMPRENDDIERVFAITLNDHVVGSIGLSLEWEHLRAEIGYWVGEDYRGRGYASAALTRTTELGFAMGLRRIYALVLLENLGSIRVLETAGFKREGKLRQHILKWGVQHDVWIYAQTVKR